MTVPKNFTCLLGKLRTEFNSAIAKSTSPELSDKSSLSLHTDFKIFFFFLDALIPYNKIKCNLHMGFKLKRSCMLIEQFYFFSLFAIKECQEYSKDY